MCCGIYVFFVKFDELYGVRFKIVIFGGRRVSGFLVCEFDWFWY